MDDQRAHRASGKLIVHKEEIVSNGIAMEVSVRHELGGYFGAYFCKPCHDGSVTYDFLPTPDAALQDARERAKLHAEHQHKK